MGLTTSRCSRNGPMLLPLRVENSTKFEKAVETEHINHVVMVFNLNLNKFQNKLHRTSQLNQYEDSIQDSLG